MLSWKKKVKKGWKWKLAAERKKIEAETKAEENVQQEKINDRNNQAMMNQNEIVKLDVNQIDKRERS